MHIRFVTKTIHAYLDYPVALSLLAMPFILTLLTNHQTGLIKVIPYWLHVAVDRLVGVVFIVATFALGFHGLDMWYYLANAVAVLLVTTVFNAPEPVTDAVGLAHA